MRISDYNCKYFRNSDILYSFLYDVRKYPVPTADEEEMLVRQYKENGDESAKDRLIVSNLRFIYALAKIYARNEDEVIDYVNEGAIGLQTALDKYDIENGSRFLTYGVWYIRRQMNYYLLRNRDLIAHSAQVGNITKKSELIRQKYFAEHGTLPTDEQVKKILLENYDIKVSKDEDMYMSGISSIDEEISDDYKLEEANEFNERTATYNEYEKTADEEYNSELLGKYLKTIDPRVADIICLKFGVGKDRAYTSEEIGEMLNVTPERIEKICDFAVLEMRKSTKKIKTVI